MVGGFYLFMSYLLNQKKLLRFITRQRPEIKIAKDKMNNVLHNLLLSTLYCDKLRYMM